MKNAARNAIFKCMGLKDEESLLIITDEKLRRIGEVFFETGRERGNEVILMEIISRKMHGEEPPDMVADAMKMVDVCIIPTSMSMSHTKARKEASEKGVRIASLPGITEDIMVRTLNADYKRIKECSLYFATLLSSAREAHIISGRGTDFYVFLEGRKGHPDTGIYHNPGDFGNLPAGEAYIAPVEGKSYGKIVFDGSFAGIGLLEEPLIFYVEKGRVEKIEGKYREFFECLFEKYGDNARNIAELGIGTNPRAMVKGNVLEDEKAKGTIHIAIGDNSTFGGEITVPLHLDGVIKEPLLLLDGEKISLDF